MLCCSTSRKKRSTKSFSIRRLAPQERPARPESALPPFRVQALYDAGLTYLARAFVNGAVLIGAEEVLVGLVAIGDDGLVQVVGRHI